eukprot:gene1617-33007_t
MPVLLKTMLVPQAGFGSARIRQATSSQRPVRTCAAAPRLSVADRIGMRNKQSSKKKKAPRFDIDDLDSADVVNELNAGGDAEEAFYQSSDLAGTDLEGTAARGNEVLVDEVYAHRNASILSVLRKQGRVVIVGNEDEEDEEEDVDMDDYFKDNYDKDGGVEEGGGEDLSDLGFKMVTSDSGEVFMQRTVSSDKEPSQSRRAAAPAALKPLNINQALKLISSPEQMLDFICLAYPSWAQNGCRLLTTAGTKVPGAPSPLDVCIIMKAVADAALREGVTTRSKAWLCRDVRITGLAECLLLTPPRLSPDADPSASSAVFKAAKAFWLGVDSEDPLQEEWTNKSRRKKTKSQLPPKQKAICNGSYLQDKWSNNSKRKKTQSQLPPKQKAILNVLWAMSSLGGPAYFEAEMKILMAVLKLGASRLSGDEACNLLWALANARHWTDRLPDIESCIIKIGGLQGVSPGDSSLIRWAFASLGHNCQIGGLQGISPGDSSRILWAFASLGYNCQRLIFTAQLDWSYEVQGGKRGDIHSFNLAQLCSVAWSLAALEQTNSELMLSVWAEIMARGEGAIDANGKVSLKEAALNQMWQAYMAISLESGDDEDLASASSSSQAARDCFLRQTSALRQKVHSNYQKQIASCLADMGIMHLLEDNTCGYAIDIAIPALRIAIEADGPTHLARNDSSHVLGATNMKRRLLELMGWQVINVTFEEWDELPSAVRRTAFLRECIEDAMANTDPTEAHVPRPSFLSSATFQNTASSPKSVGTSLADLAAAASSGAFEASKGKKKSPAAERRAVMKAQKKATARGETVQGSPDL